MFLLIQEEINMKIKKERKEKLEMWEEEKNNRVEWGRR